MAEVEPLKAERSRIQPGSPQQGIDVPVAARGRRRPLLAPPAGFCFRPLSGQVGRFALRSNPHETPTGHAIHQGRKKTPLAGRGPAISCSKALRAVEALPISTTDRECSRGPPPALRCAAAPSSARPAGQSRHGVARGWRMGAPGPSAFTAAAPCSVGEDSRPGRQGGSIARPLHAPGLKRSAGAKRSGRRCCAKTRPAPARPACTPIRSGRPPGMRMCATLSVKIRVIHGLPD